MQAIWNDTVIAESDKTVVVDNNHYFPRDSVKAEYLQASDKQTSCPWKGTAKYYSLNIGGKVNESAAWYYPEPKSGAIEIKDHLAFWKGVVVR
jgi:uncharacterized protein (DUF427 family)